MTINKEAVLHRQVCDYIRMRFPTTIFHSDVGAGLKLTMGQATRNKYLQSSRGWPDLFIAEPRYNWHGLFLELKADGVVLYKKDGTLRANEHIAEQADMLERLTDRGYAAYFAVGFEQARQLIDRYLKDERTN